MQLQTQTESRDCSGSPVASGRAEIVDPLHDPLGTLLGTLGTISPRVINAHFYCNGQMRQCLRYNRWALPSRKIHVISSRCGGLLHQKLHLPPKNGADNARDDNFRWQRCAALRADRHGQARRASSPRGHPRNG